MNTENTFNKFEENIENIVKETPNIDLSIVIIDNDNTFYKNFGKATETSLFPIASLTKPIVSMAFLELLNEKNILIDTKLEEFDINFLNKNFQNKITLKHLLTHRTGFKNTGELFSYTDNKTLSDFIQELDKEPIGEVGDFAYSNNNYNILRFIIEKITNITFEEFLYNFLNKLDMNDTGYIDGFGEMHSHASLQNHGHLYDLDENLVEIKEYPNNLINNPSFNLISTSKDMGKFLQYFISRDEALISRDEAVPRLYKNTIFESATTLTFNYENTPDGYFLDHNGLLATGFQSYIRIVPEKNLAFCILANELSLNIESISNIITRTITNGEYKHNFIKLANNIIPKVILENIQLGFYKGYEAGIIELFIEDDNLFLNIFEQDYLIHYYGGNKFYHNEDGFFIELIIDFEKNKTYLNSEALLPINKPHKINKNKIGRKLRGVYKHKQEILPDLEIFTEYENENIKIFLLDSMEEFEIFTFDSENEVVLPDYGHLIINYNHEDKVIGFELDSFEKYIKI
jgi:CubicO group peptidase (beta-lactamase class C family)